MDKLFPLLIGGLIGLLGIAIGAIVAYRNFRKLRKSLFAQIQVAEQELIDELAKIDINELRTTQSGAELLQIRGLNVKSPKSVSADIKIGSIETQNQQDSQADRSQQQRIEMLRKIDLAIATNLDPQVTLNTLVSQIATQLNVDATAILLFDRDTNKLNYVAGFGFYTRDTRLFDINVGDDILGQEILKRSPIKITNLNDSNSNFSRKQLVNSESFISYNGIPIYAKGDLLGLLEIYHRTPIAFTSETLDLLELTATQAAVAIENSQLFESLQRSNMELALAYDATIEGWSRALELRDNTEGHTQRVTDLTLRLAKSLNVFSKEDLVNVRRGAILHNIGKMGIPDSILRKQDPLTEEEKKILYKQPEFAYDMLAPINYLRPALDIPHSYRERWDGTGYPRGLKGEEIPLAARVFAVAETWDALITDRPYRKAMRKEKALEYIREQAGREFDPQVVQEFLKIV